MSAYLPASDRIGGIEWNSQRTSRDPLIVEGGCQTSEPEGFGETENSTRNPDGSARV